MPYCQNCGKEVGETAKFCASCGDQIGTTPAGIVQGTGKSKVASILLAVFLSFWTWLYTYRKDGWKFWLGLGLTILIFPWFGVWVWAIVDTAVKSDNWYRNY